MKLKEDVTLAGINLLMRPALVCAEQIWKDMGRSEGVTVTSAREGAHSAGSWHYYGLALDFRTRYFTDDEVQKAARKLKTQLPGYDIIVHSTHIHVEPGNSLLKRHGLL